MTSIMVTGSRVWPNTRILYTVLTEFLISHTTEDDGLITLINGGAQGVDTLVQEYWRSNDIGNVITVYPDWARHGRRAGIVLNIDMINLDPTYVLAFIYNGSKGATFTYEESLRRGLDTYAFIIDSNIKQEVQ